MIERLLIQTKRQGLFDITDDVSKIVRASGVPEGLCSLFVQHTSASLIIQENADPSAKHDLESWINRLVPENDPHFTHTLEGSDDMPSHIKSAITASTLSIPIVKARLALGTWQGIYLWEHRTFGHKRSIVVHISE